MADSTLVVVVKWEGNFYSQYIRILHFYVDYFLMSLGTTDFVDPIAKKRLNCAARCGTLLEFTKKYTEFLPFLHAQESGKMIYCELCRFFLARLLW